MSRAMVNHATKYNFCICSSQESFVQLERAWCSTNSSAAHRETKTNMSYISYVMPDAWHPTPQNNLSSAGY